MISDAATPKIVAEFSAGFAPAFFPGANPIQRCNVETVTYSYRGSVMRKVLRGYAKDRDGNLILMGTISVLHSKDKASPRERQDKRHLIRRGATIFKKEIVR